MNRATGSLFVVALWLGVAASVAAGDVLVLTDGSEVAGKVRRTQVDGRDGYEVTTEDGGTRFIDANRVRQVILGRNEVSPDNGDKSSGIGEAPTLAESRLASLRRSVANLNDLSLIISKYETFLRQNESGPAVEEARKELETWRDRQARGFVKLGKEWVTPEDRDRRLASALGRVNEARLTVKAGDEAEARELATALLEDEASAAGGHYLLGVLDLRNDQVGPARQHFEQVREREPTHVPTLVNLAVIQTRLDRPERAMWFLAEAMTHAPGTREVLDNALEALNLLPAEATDERNARRAATLFEQQDAQLRQEMEAQGLHRWGSQWVDQERYEELEAIQREIEAAVAELKVHYDEHATAVRQIESRIESNEAYMQRLVSASIVTDAEGRMIRMPLPESYYQTQRENQALAAEREQRLREMRRLDQAAAAERQKMPVPLFTGELTFIGEDGVPVMLPPESSTTEPATRPTGGE